MDKVTRNDEKYQSFLESQHTQNLESEIILDSFEGYIKHCFKPRKVTIGHSKKDGRVVSPNQTDGFCRVSEEKLKEKLDSNKSFAKVVSASPNDNSLFLYYSFNVKTPTGEKVSFFNSEKNVWNLSKSELASLIYTDNVQIMTKKDETVIKTDSNEISVQGKRLQREATENFQLFIDYLLNDEDWLSAVVKGVKYVENRDEEMAIVLRTERGSEFEIMIDSIEDSENKLSKLSETLLDQSDDPLLIENEKVSLKPFSECDITAQAGVIEKSWLIKYPVSSFSDKKDTPLYNLLNGVTRKIR